MLNRIKVDLRATATIYLRSRSAMFWTLAFPVLLIVLFGAIFSGSGDATYDIYVQDLDGSDASRTLIASLEGTGVLDVKEVPADQDASAYVERESLSNILIIPGGYAETVGAGGVSELDLRMDQTLQSSQVIHNVVSAVVQETNLAVAGADRSVSLGVSDIVTEDMDFLDFFVPGVIGLTVMTSGVNYMVSTFTRYRAAGLFRKLSTTPMTRLEWLLSRGAWQILQSFVSLAIILGVGVGLFGMNVSLDIVAVLLIVFGSVMFSALGMVMTAFLKEGEGADAAASAVTFPMMFLGGSFFAIESFPAWLQPVARAMPLTYLNEGLRDCMVYGNTSSALANLAVVIALAVALSAIAAKVTDWSDE